MLGGPGFGLGGGVEPARAARDAALEHGGAELACDRVEPALCRRMAAERDLTLSERERPMRARGIVVAVDHRFMRHIRLGPPRLVEQRDQEAEAVRVDRAGR